MKHINKIIKDAKKEGIELDIDLVKGLRAIQRQHDIIQKFKKQTGLSPSAVWNEMHRKGIN